MATPQEQDIKILSPIEHMRMRPDMYIGNSATCEILNRELLDNAFDECSNGFSKKLVISSIKDASGREGISVEDFGRGLPQHLTSEGIPTCRLLFTEPYSGGKFDHANYKTSSGLHGIGLTACFALSSKLEIETFNGESRYFAVCEKGVLKSEELSPSKRKSGTCVKLFADPEIFENTKPKIDKLSLRIAKLQMPDVDFEFNGESISPLAYSDLFQEKTLTDDKFEFSFEEEASGFKFKLLFNWSKQDFDCRSFGTVNNITVNRGLHIKTARSVICNALIEKLGNANADIGLRFHVIASLPDQRFSSQDKENLTKADSIKTFADTIQKKLKAYLKDFNFEMLALKILKYKESIDNLSKTEFINSKVKKGTGSKPNRNLGPGIFECTAIDREGTELFIVEGKSAASGLVEQRTTSKHAILPLRGKPLNTCSVGESNYKRIFGNNEISLLVNTVGEGVYPHEDIDSIRYDKIIIFSDADPDGKNISALILGAFAFLMPGALKAGKVYTLKTPLYAQNHTYHYDQSTLDTSKPFSRFKGLGEMNPEQLAEIAFGDGRILQKLTVDSEEDINYIKDLVGKGSVKKELLQEHGLI